MGIKKKEFKLLSPGGKHAGSGNHSGPFLYRAGDYQTKRGAVFYHDKAVRQMKGQILLFVQNKPGAFHPDASSTSRALACFFLRPP